MAGDVKWYGDKVKKEIRKKVGTALNTSALVVEGDAKRLCPVDT